MQNKFEKSINTPLIDNGVYKIELDKYKVLSNLERQILEEELLILKPLEPNKFDVTTINIHEREESYEAKVIIRNSCDVPVEFKEIGIAVVDKDDKILSTFIIDLSSVGFIDSMIARVTSISINKNLVGLIEIGIHHNFKIINNAEIIDTNKITNILYTDNINEYEKMGIENFVKELHGYVEGYEGYGFYKIVEEKDEIYGIVYVINATNKPSYKVDIPIYIYNNMMICVAYDKILRTQIIPQYSILFIKHLIHKSKIIFPTEDLSRCHGNTIIE